MKLHILSISAPTQLSLSLPPPSQQQPHQYEMGFLSPESWIYNRTEDKLVLITEDELGFRVGEKQIKPGGHTAMGYRIGIDRVGPRIHFWVHPENRTDLRGPKIMPSDVFDHSDIDVVYKLGDGSVSAEYEEGALVGFMFKDDTMLSRIGFVRRCGQVYASLAKFGNCYYETPASASAPAPVQAHVVAPAAVEAPIHAHAVEEALALVEAMAPVLAPALVEVTTLPAVEQATTQAPTSIDVLAPAAQGSTPTLPSEIIQVAVNY